MTVGVRLSGSRSRFSTACSIPRTMLDTEVYVKTDAGRDEIRSRTQGLSMAARAILLMVDGQRPVGVMRTLIAGSKAPADILETLVEQGLIEPLDGLAPPPAAAAPKPVEAVLQPLARRAVQTPVVEPARGMDLPPPRMAPPAARAALDGPLDLELPTIQDAQTDPPAPAAARPPPTATAFDAAAPVKDRYERLYAMMNEIARDFLAPHRRYFFQLKIERCTTAEELSELLHGLQTTLAKARGEAFASDVIARIRSAAD